MFKRILIIISLIMFYCISIIGGIYVYSKFNDRYEEICVASHQLNQRTCISEDDLKIIKVSKSIISDDLYVCKQDVINKYVKLGFTIPSNSFIYKTSLDNNIKDSAHTMLDHDEVNYDLYINEIKVNSASICKGMLIDLYLTIDDKNKPISDLLISNAKISGIYDNNNKEINDYDNDSKAYILSIIINKDMINIINKAQIIGELSVIVTSDTYSTKNVYLNNNSIILDYIE